MVESSLNPYAIGTKGEVGLFQIMPKISSQLGRRNINAHIKEAVEMLKHWKDVCPLQEGSTFVICYNNGYRHPKYPLLHPYYKKVMGAMNAQ